jgi:hypothetical protein
MMETIERRNGPRMDPREWQTRYVEQGKPRHVIGLMIEIGSGELIVRPSGLTTGFAVAQVALGRHLGNIDGT